MCTCFPPSLFFFSVVGSLLSAFFAERLVFGGRLLLLFLLFPPQIGSCGPNFFTRCFWIPSRWRARRRRGLRPLLGHLYVPHLSLRYHSDGSGDVDVRRRGWGTGSGPSNHVRRSPIRLLHFFDDGHGDEVHLRAHLEREPTGGPPGVRSCRGGTTSTASFEAC